MSNKTAGVLIMAALAVLGGGGYYAAQAKKADDKPAGINQASAEAAKVEPAADASKSADKTADAAASAKTPSVDDPVVAKVDGQNILKSEVIAFMKNVPPQMQQLPIETIFPVVLEQVINGKIVQEKADKTSVATDPEVAQRMAEAKEQIIRVVYMEQEINKSLTPDRVKKAYDKFVSEQGKVEEVKARHILVEKESDAQDILKQLKDGAKFEDLAKQYSKDSGNKANGGELGYFTKDAMVKEFSDAAFAMKAGETSKTPVKTSFGYHIIQVEDRRTRPVPPFDQVKPAIEAQERREILTDLLESWRKKADVQTFDMNGNPIKDKPKTETPDAAK